MEHISTDIFLLTDEWQDYKGSNLLRFIGVSNDLGPVEIIINNKPVFFVERTADISFLDVPYLRKEVDMKTFGSAVVDAVYFNTQKDLKKAAGMIQEQGIKTFESDINPARRFLMEKSVNAQVNVSGVPEKKNLLLSFNNPVIKPCSINPELTIASLDIETGGDLLYSIALFARNKKEDLKKVFIIGDKEEDSPGYISFFATEQELLSDFISWFRQTDPDIIIGWHIVGFDLMFLDRKCNEYRIPFDISRGGRVSLRERSPGGYYATIPGRVVIDGPTALRMAFYSFEDYKLETVAQELLGMGKTIRPDQGKVSEIERLFREDKVKLAEYNIHDAFLAAEIFRKTRLIELSVRRSQLSGLLMDRLGMMSAAFDHFFLPRLHKEGFVAPNIKDLKTTEHSAGGYVLDPKPGIYDDIIVLDFKSLYPSIIRTFKIDPLSRFQSEIKTLITPGGYRFSAEKNYLPDFIEQLMIQRNKAIKNNDKSLSQAIKILMNSFYGVMGSYGCRFYHPDLPSAITSTGQWLLLESKKYLEKNSYEVIYGDTDSLFVKLKEEEGTEAALHGKRISDELNNYWKLKLHADFNVESCLELEFEKHYRKFILTQSRGSEAGAKKRYAGLLAQGGKEILEFVGMEYVRSDWTKLAKEFQVELYERIFYQKEINNWMNSLIESVYKGQLDDKLIYKKRLRKEVDDYVKNIPPQVRAAKMVSGISGTIYYVITRRGPVPVELKPKDIDYPHYIEKQLKPIADSILTLMGKNFDSIVKTGQLDMFDN